MKLCHIFQDREEQLENNVYPFCPLYIAGDTRSGHLLH